MSETITETASIEIYADNLGVTQAIATQLAQLVTAGNYSARRQSRQWQNHFYASIW
jgi:hypothetical protein